MCVLLSWNAEGEQAFGQALWGWCVNMAARIAAVTRHCMNGTEEEFQDVLRSFFVSYGPFSECFLLVTVARSQ